MRLIILSIVVLLSACQDERQTVPTAEEAARLDEADEMLDNAAAPPAER